jgi:hypothetical protein
MDIDDKDTLSVLMSAMYVAKWEAADSSRVTELAGSPYLSRLFNDVVDELARLDASQVNDASKLARWRAIEGRPAELERVRARIRSTRLWSSWTDEQKRSMVEYLLSPFRATPDTLKELISL